MDLTQQSVLSFLIEEGGKVKKSELVRRFKGSIDCGSPEERDRNRELFKNFVNNVAVVKEIDGGRFVVVKKKYESLVESFQARGKRGGKNEDVDVGRQGELQRTPAQTQEVSNNDKKLQEDTNNYELSENPTDMFSPIELALQRSKYDFRPKRGLNFDVQNEGAKQSTNAQSKPYALPLRMPPTNVQIQKLKFEHVPELEASGTKKRAQSLDTSSGMGSPILRRSTNSTKVSTELKETRVASVVPLDQAEHQWLVKCASGLWSQVYGLLLQDSQLAEKKDFMSGFTALHWAVKCGNSDILVKIMDVSKQGGVELDINAKAHGGYTPLHIAALHNQEYIMAMLVGEYGADPSVRDNCGRRAYHYLHKGVSKTVREMLGQPGVRKEVSVVVQQQEKEEQDVFPDRTKGLHSISKLFQPTLTGPRKKSKQRSVLYSLQDEREVAERDGGSTGVRHRLLSDVFM